MANELSVMRTGIWFFITSACISRSFCLRARMVCSCCAAASCVWIANWSLSSLFVVFRSDIVFLRRDVTDCSVSLAWLAAIRFLFKRESSASLFLISVSNCLLRSACRLVSSLKDAERSGAFSDACTGGTSDLSSASSRRVRIWSASVLTFSLNRAISFSFSRFSDSRRVVISSL